MVKNRKNKISARGQLSNVPETFQIGSGVGLFSDGIRYYMQQLLDELNSESALQVNLRLNESETFELSPVFIDWVGTFAGAQSSESNKTFLRTIQDALDLVTESCLKYT